MIGVVSFIRDGVLPGRKLQDIIYATRNSSAHGRPSMTRKTSMSAGVDAKGEVEIRVVQVKTPHEPVFESTDWGIEKGSESHDSRLMNMV